MSTPYWVNVIGTALVVIVLVVVGCVCADRRLVRLRRERAAGVAEAQRRHPAGSRSAGAYPERLTYTIAAPDEARLEADLRADPGIRAALWDHIDGVR